MTVFLNPQDFPDDDALLEHIIEHIVKPSIAAATPDDVDPEDVGGMAYVFGGKPGVQAAAIEALQARVANEGIPYEYALEECTSLQVGRRRTVQFGAMEVHYVELGLDGPPPMSVEELEARFLSD
jgi:hypothetical protein